MMAKRTRVPTATTTTRTKDAENGATFALMALASAATHAQQCKRHEVQVLRALHTENRTEAQQHVAAAVAVRDFWSAATTTPSRTTGGPVQPRASPLPLSASSAGPSTTSSAGPSTKRRAESAPSGVGGTRKKTCQWKHTVVLSEQCFRPLAPAGPARAPAAAAPSKTALRCKWQTTQQIVPGKSERTPASPCSVLSPPASPRSDCELV